MCNELQINSEINSKNLETVSSKKKFFEKNTTPNGEIYWFTAAIFDFSNFDAFPDNSDIVMTLNIHYYTFTYEIN